MSSRRLNLLIENCCDCPYLYMKSESLPYELITTWHCKKLESELVIHSSKDPGTDPEKKTYGISVFCQLPEEEESFEF